jgi:hypothetical protein
MQLPVSASGNGGAGLRGGGFGPRIRRRAL